MFCVEWIVVEQQSVRSLSTPLLWLRECWAVFAAGPLRRRRPHQSVRQSLVSTDSEARRERPTSLTTGPSQRSRILPTENQCQKDTETSLLSSASSSASLQHVGLRHHQVASGWRRYITLFQLLVRLQRNG